jgi:hypothetical protein
VLQTVLKETTAHAYLTVKDTAVLWAKYIALKYRSRVSKQGFPDIRKMQEFQPLDHEKAAGFSNVLQEYFPLECYNLHCGTRAFRNLNMEAGRSSQALAGMHIHTYHAHYTASHAVSHLHNHCRYNLRTHKVIIDFRHSVLVCSPRHSGFHATCEYRFTEGAPPFTPPHPRFIVVSSHEPSRPPSSSFLANPNARLLFLPLLSFFFLSSTKKKEHKEIALELVSLFFLSQIFAGLYS